MLLENRTQRKTATRVSGLETYLVSPPAFAQASQLLYNSSCTTVPVEKGGVKTDRLEVLIQGSVADEVARHLHTEFGIPLSHIKIVSKLKK